MGVHPLHTLTMRDVHRVGGKAASLGELLQSKQRVPHGFVVTARAQTLSPTLEQSILRMFDALQLERVAVRSSGVEEDGHGKSWAGQFVTLLNVNRGELLAAVQTCWDSAASERARAYGQPQKLAVLVQHMIESEVSGVAFSANPVTGNQEHMVIEAVYGLCEPLVSGTATPDHFVLHKSNTEMLESDIAEKRTMLAYKDGKNRELPVEGNRQTKAALSYAQLCEIAALIREVEAHYGFPVDIEWTYEGSKLYLLQARPITTL